VDTAAGGQSAGGLLSPDTGSGSGSDAAAPMWVATTASELLNKVPLLNRDAPDTVLFLPDIRLIGYPTNPKAGYRISGRNLHLATIFLVKYQINL
jgi:hypothetical protein